MRSLLPHPFGAKGVYFRHWFCSNGEIAIRVCCNGGVLRAFGIGLNCARSACAGGIVCVGIALAGSGIALADAELAPTG
ncbi:hypothetical protein U1Q18_007887 [Sarracenia purpurea var. burkii]